jgi:hypothetical protein
LQVEQIVLVIGYESDDANGYESGAANGNGDGVVNEKHQSLRMLQAELSPGSYFVFEIDYESEGGSMNVNGPSLRESIR